MPTRRFNRAEKIHGYGPLLDALRIGRQLALEAARPLRPTGEAMAEVDALVAAIDRMGEYLTGDPRLFHAGGSVGPSGVRNGIVMPRREG